MLTGSLVSHGFTCPFGQEVGISVLAIKQC